LFSDGLAKEAKKVKALNDHFKNKPSISKHGKALKLCRKELELCGAKTIELLQELSVVEETVKGELSHARTAEKHLSQFNMKGIRPAAAVQLPTPYAVCLKALLLIVCACEDIWLRGLSHLPFDWKTWMQY
jgi:hypothetical protein